MDSWGLAIEGVDFGLASDTFLAYFSETYFAGMVLVEEKLEFGLAYLALGFILRGCGWNEMVGRGRGLSLSHFVIMFFCVCVILFMIVIDVIVSDNQSPSLRSQV